MAALLEILERDPAAARRRWTIAALGLVALVGIPLALRATMTHDKPACPAAAPLLAGVWDEPRRAAMHAAFEASGKPYQADAFRSAAAILDRFASGG